MMKFTSTRTRYRSTRTFVLQGYMHRTVRVADYSTVRYRVPSTLFPAPPGAAMRGAAAGSVSLLCTYSTVLYGTFFFFGLLS